MLKSSQSLSSFSGMAHGVQKMKKWTCGLKWRIWNGSQDNYTTEKDETYWTTLKVAWLIDFKKFSVFSLVFFWSHKPLDYFPLRISSSSFCTPMDWDLWVFWASVFSVENWIERSVAGQDLPVSPTRWLAFAHQQFFSVTASKLLKVGATLCH